MCLYVRVCYNSQFMIGVLSEYYDIYENVNSGETSMSTCD